MAARIAEEQLLQLASGLGLDKHRGVVNAIRKRGRFSIVVWAKGAAGKVILLKVLVLGLVAVPVKGAEIKGRVVDEQGQPVAGAILGTSWHTEKGLMKPYSKVVSGLDGTFSWTERSLDRPVALMAIDANQTRGAMLVLSNPLPAAPLVLKLAALVTVRGEFDCEQLGKPPEWSNAMLNVMPERIRLVQDMSDPPRFMFKVPPGNYQLHGYGTDVTGVNRELNLEASKGLVDVGRINIEAWPLALHYGKALPAWHVTEARGLPQDVRVGDFKGKWVLIEFWGHW